MAAPAYLDRTARHRRIVEAGSLDALLDQPDGLATLEAEAADPDQKHRLITEDQLAHLLAARRESAAGPTAGSVPFSAPTT